MRGLLLFALTLLPATLAQGQAKARPTFDVASIRMTKPGTQNGMIKAIPGGHGYTAQNIPVRLMIALMYRIPARQISGGPGWLDSDRYDVEARVEGAYSVDELHVMFQNLLADRFNLKFHVDTRQGNVYALTIDPSGLKMKVNDAPQDYNIPILFGPSGDSIGTRVSMTYLAWWLGQQLQRDERPVIDRTGLDKNYDFHLSFAPILPPDTQREPDANERPSIFEALKSQLGLRLQPQQGPVDFFVIDHVDKPSEN